MTVLAWIIVGVIAGWVTWIVVAYVGAVVFLRVQGVLARSRARTSA